MTDTSFCCGPVINLWGAYWPAWVLCPEFRQMNLSSLLGAGRATSLTVLSEDG